MGTKQNLFMPASSQSLAEERRLRQIARDMIVTKTDTADLDKYLARFKNVCMEVRELNNDPRFRGTYDEILNYSLSDRDTETVKKIDILRLLDTMINLEARKLGLSGSQWLERCWHDEIAAAAKQPDSRSPTGYSGTWEC